jgi:hypothetical protein
MTDTNPQNFSDFKVDTTYGFRLLTPEELAILTDKEPAGTDFRKSLFAHLKPEFYSESACRWVEASTVTELLTYRTRAPLAQGPQEIHPCDFIADTAAADFVDNWNAIAAIHHTLMRSKGFWKMEDELCDLLEAANRPDLFAAVIAAFDGQKIALQTSEASEALEGLRHGNGPDDKIPQFTAAEAEFADVILRMMDHAYARGWDVAGALIEKFKMNAGRANMHGKQF